MSPPPLERPWSSIRGKKNNTETKPDDVVEEKSSIIWPPNDYIIKSCSIRGGAGAIVGGVSGSVFGMSNAIRDMRNVNTTLKWSDFLRPNQHTRIMLTTSGKTSGVFLG